MKNLIIGSLATIFFLVIILFIFTVYGRNVREQEINDGMNNAMKIAIEMLMEDEEYAPQNDEELISDFVQAFLLHVNSSSTVTIEVLDVDYTIGLLSVRVTSDYKHLTGTPGKVSFEKTIILEQYENENAISSYTITYYIEGTPYKEYVLTKDSNHIVPSYLAGYSGTLVGWKVTEGDNIGQVYSVFELSNMPVTGNTSYIAVIN